MFDIIIVGSGPAGLSCAISAQKEGLNYLILEKETITNSIYHFPISMEFFTTRELIEIGDYPLTIVNTKPTREEALRYYAKIVIDKKINIKTYEKVVDVQEENGHFKITSKVLTGKTNHYHSKKVIVATGAYDNPRMLNIPGENLPKVSHYYKEAHSYVGKKVLIIGGANSSAETGLDLFRNGADVTISVRDKEFKHLKYWILPDLLNRIKDKSIKCIYESHVKEIREGDLLIQLKDGTVKTLENDFVLALTGYVSDCKLLKAVGVEINDKNHKPVHNTKTLETNIRGVFVAGVITAGDNSGLVFIENGRFHGEKIIPNLLAQM